LKACQDIFLFCDFFSIIFISNLKTFLKNEIFFMKHFEAICGLVMWGGGGFGGGGVGVGGVVWGGGLFWYHFPHPPTSPQMTKQSTQKEEGKFI
jgi:hypothetical protein